MIDRIARIIEKRIRPSYHDIEPDEIFLDSSNLPEFDVHQFEGRLIKPIAKSTIVILGFAFMLVASIFLWRVGMLQIVRGQEYAEIGENNRLAHTYLFPERGVVFDKDNVLLAWNVPKSAQGSEEGEEYDFSARAYTATSGLSHVLGYVKYPQADSSGNYYKTEYTGEAGVESEYDAQLKGENGLKIIERDALLNVKSESVIEPPTDGDDVLLTIDTAVQSALYGFIESLSHERGFHGGAGIIMDIHTGGIVALTSYPEYSSNIMSSGDDVETIASYNTDTAKPYLNRAISGRYTPGSIVKPFFALAALNEGVVTADTEIYSSGRLVVPNPWDPTLPGTIFNDWKAHGWTDAREAIAVSSDVYFYEIGGGYAPDNQKGIGIANLEKYSRMFGIGELTHIDLPGEVDGVIPNPEWKAANFNGEDWLIGNTYHTSIGQYGFQVTPIQMVRAIGAIATNGLLVTPHVVMRDAQATQIEGVDPYYFQVAQEGMRQAVTAGTAKGLNVDYMKIAAKTGTAEVGAQKEYVNSWILGYFPYEDPKYAFVVMMEKGPHENTVGGLYVMRQLFDWMYYHAPEYIR
jgi:penicillin-binding protein 2